MIAKATTKYKKYQIICDNCGEPMDIFCVGEVIIAPPPENTKYYCYKCAVKLRGKKVRKEKK